MNSKKIAPLVRDGRDKAASIHALLDVLDGDASAASLYLLTLPRQDGPTPGQHFIEELADAEHAAFMLEIEQRARELNETETLQVNVAEAIPSVAEHRPRAAHPVRRHLLSVWHRPPRQDRSQKARAASHVTGKGTKPTSNIVYFIEWEQDNIVWRLTGYDESRKEGQPKPVILTKTTDNHSIILPIALELTVPGRDISESIPISDEDGVLILSGGKYGDLADISIALEAAKRTDDLQLINALTPTVVMRSGS